MKEEANRKASELRLISKGSPNPTAPRQPQYRPYYERKIPFRPVICRILCLADRNPILSKVRTKIPVGPASPDYEIKERTRELRQLAAAIAFDLLDSALDVSVQPSHLPATDTRREHGVHIELVDSNASKKSKANQACTQRRVEGEGSVAVPGERRIHSRGGRCERPEREPGAQVAGRPRAEALRLGWGRRGCRARAGGGTVRSAPAVRAC